MKSLALWLAMIGLALTTIALLNKKENEGLPIVKSSAPIHGFVCTPTITPRIRPVHPLEIA